MIWCLHGNVGMAADWDVLTQFPQSPFQGEILRKVDLWRYQECRSIGLGEFGDIFSSEVSAQDPEPTLIGYSMGGRLALHAMVSAPTLWKRVILISVHPGLTSAEEKEARRIKDAEWSALAMTQDWSTFLQAWNRQAVLGEVAETLPDRYFLQPRAHAVARAFNAWSLGEQEDLREKVSACNCPVTLISGEKDEKFTRLMESFSFKNATHHVIKNTGHRTLWENPAETLAVM